MGVSRELLGRPLHSRWAQRRITDIALLLTGIFSAALIIGSLYYLLEPKPWRQKFWAIALLIILPIVLFNAISMWRQRRRTRKLNSASFISPPSQV